MIRYKNTVHIVIEDLDTKTKRALYRGAFADRTAAEEYCASLNDLYREEAMPRIAFVKFT